MESFEQTALEQGNMDDAIRIQLQNTAGAPLPMIRTLNLLGVRGTRLGIPMVFRELSGIESLSFVNAGIPAMVNLDGMQRLVSLDLSRNRILEVAGLSNNEELRRLRLDGNPVLSLDRSNFAKTPHLEALSLRQTYVGNLIGVVRALSGLLELRSLAFQRREDEDEPPPPSQSPAAPEAVQPPEPVTPVASSVVAGGGGEVPLGTIVMDSPETNLLTWGNVAGGHDGDDDWGEDDDFRDGDTGGEEDDVGWDESDQEFSDGELTLAGFTATPAPAAEAEAGIGMEMPQPTPLQLRQPPEPREFLVHEPEPLTERLASVSIDDAEMPPAVHSPQALPPSDVPVPPQMPPPPPRPPFDNMKSRICDKPCYRAFLIHFLPQLEYLDGKRITPEERQHATEELLGIYEFPTRCNFARMLTARELGLLEAPASRNGARSLLGRFTAKGKADHMRASFEGIAADSAANPFSKTRFATVASGEAFPRQFEYSVHMPGEMIYGSMDGDVVLVNHNTGEALSRLRRRMPGHVLALSFLRQRSHGRAFVAGSDEGFISYVDMAEPSSPYSKDFAPFSRLTSVHVNSTDQHVLASGYTQDVKMLDIDTGKVVRIFEHVHEEHVNVVKFANDSPFVFASSSFDRSMGLWDLRMQSPLVFKAPTDNGCVMVIFSPDDRYLLGSAVDNEIRQIYTGDGRLHLRFDVQQRHSPNNYTRSYYMNNGEYVIAGSCEENVVRVLSSFNGRLLAEVPLDPFGEPLSSSALYVQSLRGDPHNPFHFSCLVAFNSLTMSTALVKANLFGC